MDEDATRGEWCALCRAAAARVLGVQQELHAARGAGGARARARTSARARARTAPLLALPQGLPLRLRYAFLTLHFLLVFPSAM